ncbi:MAG: type IV pilus twitching motility protein PilT [Rickettsiales bacterium]|nr:type IV pilus twitching motility protein PilT [Rickettsiales bacterium]
MEKILTYAVSSKCSDVHITTGSPPYMRVDGDIKNIPNAPVLDEVWIAEILASVMNDVQKEIFKKNLELDFSIRFSDQVRFRVNAFRTINGPAAVFREIPITIKNLTSIEAPAIVKNLVNARRGLVLVVGPTGSGKSTTLAAMLDEINNNFTNHIITIEDPVEFVHKNKKSIVNQREVGESTLSFSNALRGALREDPDVILVGEMRDVETIRLALTAAETGHLVFGTLHTSSAAQTVNRIIDVFPTDDKPVIRSMLSTSLKAVISQRLLKKVGGGRHAVFEVMIANASIKNLIREDKIPQINSIMELGKKSGMRTMKESIEELLNNKVITKEEAEKALAAAE